MINDFKDVPSLPLSKKIAPSEPALSNPDANGMHNDPDDDESDSPCAPDFLNEIAPNRISGVKVESVDIDGPDFSEERRITFSNF